MNDHSAKRVVVLVDMDCFYCQVEVQHDPTLAGKPVAVVQYNSWRGGGIIAVNYEARARGVDRHMRGDDAVRKCPDLNLVRVKELHGKADLSKYREASQKVFKVLSEFSLFVERASIDEAYIDLTNAVNDHIASNHNPITETDLPNTFVQGYSDQNSKVCKNKNIESWLHDVYNNELQDEYLLHLTVGAMMVEKLRELVFKKTGFHCSAGISNNKILAKLACGLHKPNQQTLLPPFSVPNLFESIPIKKVRSLGGKLGNRVKHELNCEFMSDLAKIPLNNLRKKFDEKTCNFLYQISKGIDYEPVQSRLISKSIGSCKSFPLGLKIKEEVNHWLNTLINDIIQKLEADYETNKRKATLMTVSAKYLNKETNLPTSQCGEINSYCNNKLLECAYSMLCAMTENQKTSTWKNPLSYLGVAIGKFVEVKATLSIDNYFSKRVSKEENNILLNKPEIKSSSSKTDVSTATCTLHVEQKPTSPKKNTTITHHSSVKKNEVSTNSIKNIKTMFAQMKNSTILGPNCIETENNLSTITENSMKNNVDSFFSNKLKIISPVKNLTNLGPNCIETENNLSTITENTMKNNVDSFFNNKLKIISPVKNLSNCSDEISSTPESFFSKKLKIISPLKNIQNDIVEKVTPLPDNLFSKKLQMPSEDQTNSNLSSLSTIQSSVNESNFENDPVKLLCERCNQMIDIEEYDEHIDYHFAFELDKSLNTNGNIRSTTLDQTCTTKSKKKKNEYGQKRKYNSKESSSNHKKPCKTISSYFKPVINPQ